MEEKIAIVIPAYKRRFLRHTLDSIAGQTCRNFVVYIGDDASPQRLEEIVAGYADKMDIAYRRFETNLGGTDLPGHWDRCMALVKEPVIWFFSDDDLMPRDGVERVLKAVETYGTVNRMFRFPLAVVDEKDRVLHANPPLPEHPVSGYQFLLDKLEGRIYSAACEYVFTRDVYERIGGFVKFPSAWCSDDATWTSMGEKADGIIPLPGKPVCWRNAAGENISCSSRYDKAKITATGRFIRWVAAFYPDKLQDKSLRHGVKRYAHTVLRYSLDGRYRLCDLLRICRGLWKISPSVALSVAFRMGKLKLRTCFEFFFKKSSQKKAGQNSNKF